MSNLKARVMKLENVVTPKEYGGIIIYTDNEVREEEKALSADFYLSNDTSVNPLTVEELANALKGKTLITYLPIKDKRKDIKMVKIEK